MADKKRHNFEQLIYNKDLKKVPLVFRFLEVKKTDETQVQHRTAIPSTGVA